MRHGFFSVALAFAPIVVSVFGHDSPTKTAHVDHRMVGVARQADAASPPNCFPAVGFKMPPTVPASTANWWCPDNTEYAFMGFSYEVTACQSLATMKKEFLDVKNTFQGRYVRLYGACDRNGFYNDVIEAAWGAGIGVHSLIWFGWDAPNAYKARRDALLSILHSNPKAKFVTKVVQFGSEPLYDYAIEPNDLVTEIANARKNLTGLGIPITISEMAYGYQVRASVGSMNVMKTIDFIDAHMLPFFSQQASTAKNSWPIVETDLNWFINNGSGKKIYLSQNGWPSTTYSGVEPNSPSAVANVANEKDYFDLLDSKCSYFKSVAGGGIGWFAHIYSENQEPGYGVYGYDGRLKFAFAPRTSC